MGFLCADPVKPHGGWTAGPAAPRARRSWSSPWWPPPGRSRGANTALVESHPLGQPQPPGLTFDAAVPTALVPICHAQEKMDGTKGKRLGELKALTASYEQTDFVMKAGWATVPGKSDPNRDVT